MNFEYCKDNLAPCCFRERGKCRILNNTVFNDGHCRFRKLSPEGKNLYDWEVKTYGQKG